MLRFSLFYRPVLPELSSSCLPPCFQTRSIYRYLEPRYQDFQDVFDIHDLIVDYATRREQISPLLGRFELVVPKVCFVQCAHALVPLSCLAFALGWCELVF